MNKERFLRLIGLLSEATISNGDYLRSFNFSELRKTAGEPTGNPKEFYQELQLKAKNGPIFSSNTINTIEKLPMDLSKPETKWIASVLENDSKVDLRELPSLLDFIKNQKPDLSKMTWKEALKQSELWHKQFDNQSENQFPSEELDKNSIVFRCSDGYYWVKLTTSRALKTEGFKMKHCVGGYWDQVKSGQSVIFSLRDSADKPHVTMELNPKNKQIVQIMGFEDSKPIESLHKYISEFLGKLEHKWSESSLEYAGAEVLALLAKDKDAGVRRAVARNPNAPSEVLALLAKDKEASVRDSAIKNLKARKQSNLQELLRYLL